MSDHLSNHTNCQRSQQKIIGLVPAAGKATRLSPLPFSKELYPIGFQRLDNGYRLNPKPVCLNLLETMRLAGTTEAYIVLRKGKWDIPAYLCDGKMLDMHLAYLMMDLPFGVPYTLDQAYPFIKDNIVVFGFPDILFQPNDSFCRLLARQETSGADIVLGLFPWSKPVQMDMVDIDANDQIQEVQIKPASTHLRYTWIIAVWTQMFTHFMHEYIITCQNKLRKKGAPENVKKQQELFLGEVVQAAVDSKMHIEGVVFHDGDCLDIGVPENLVTCIHSHEPKTTTWGD